jgi:hypothetical protein
MLEAWREREEGVQGHDLETTDAIWQARKLQDVATHLWQALCPLASYCNDIGILPAYRTDKDAINIWLTK